MCNIVEALVYSKKPCPYCEQAKTLLTRKNISYRELDVTIPEVLDQLRNLIPGAKTVPQIFIEGTYVGGYTELVEHLK
jgi:glutaredoxin 3